MVEIIWSDLAKNDLKEIISYISNDSINYATLFKERVFEKIDILRDFPKIGRKVSESDAPNTRELIFQNYRIIYELLEDSIEIITIIHGSRLLKV